MKKSLIISLISLLTMGMTANSLAGCFTLTNHSQKGIRFGYGVKYKDNRINNGTIVLDHKTPSTISFCGNETYQIASITNAENNLPVQCSGLELNKFFSTLKVTINPDGNCIAQTTP